MVRDLRIYAEALDDDVFHYRDSNGLECDSVIHLRNGKYGLVEIKLGGQSLIEDGVATLNKFESTIDTEKMNAPSFKMILTAVGKIAYMIIALYRYHWLYKALKRQSGRLITSHPDVVSFTTIRELAPLFNPNQLLCLTLSYTKASIIPDLSPIVISGASASSKIKVVLSLFKR